MTLEPVYDFTARTYVTEISKELQIQRPAWKENKNRRLREARTWRCRDCSCVWKGRGKHWEAKAHARSTGHTVKKPFISNIGVRNLDTS